MSLIAWLLDTIQWLLGNPNFQFYLIAYCVGGIPFGLVILRLFYHIDLREVGSGSIGATNVLRALQQKDISHAKIIALLTVILDALKGALVIVAARIFEMGIDVQWTVAVLSVVGHCYSPFLKFEGGKGIATGVGVMLVLLPIEAMLGLLAWFIVGRLSKISSLASIAGLSGFLISNYFINPTIPGIESHAPIVIIAVIILWKHLPNIQRILQGKEQKIVLDRRNNKYETRNVSKS